MNIYTMPVYARDSILAVVGMCVAFVSEMICIFYKMKQIQTFATSLISETIAITGQINITVSMSF